MRLGTVRLGTVGLGTVVLETVVLGTVGRSCPQGSGTAGRQVGERLCRSCGLPIILNAEQPGSAGKGNKPAEPDYYPRETT